MTDPVDAEILADALIKTQQRYPYLSLRIRKNEDIFFCEHNPDPVVLFHTDKRISLNCPDANYHVWAVCYWGDMIHLDISHGTADGTGMYMVLATLLFYYCAGRRCLKLFRF